MTSYITDGSVGPWAKEKLECLEKYLHAYTTILKEQRWCEGYVYIDAFAGAGKAALRKYDTKNNDGLLLSDVAGYAREDEEETAPYILGSPRVALNISYPFTEYVFVEQNPKRIQELKELANEYGETRNITILEGDANDQIKKHLLTSGRYNWEKFRAVAFLDPFGLQVPWNTIETIGRTEAIELILNLPVGMAIQRLLPRSGVFAPEQKEKLDMYFGSKDWEHIVYEEKEDLFGSHVIKNDSSGIELAKWYQKRLKKAYGFSSKPRLIKNTKGGHLYYLLWAGPNKTGAKIATHVMKQGELV